MTSITSYLRDTGYTEEGLKSLGLMDFPWKHAGLRTILRQKAEPSSPLAALAELFYLGAPVEVDRLRKVLHKDALDAMLAAALLVSDGTQAEATCMLTWFRSLLIASDRVRRLEETPSSDAVLGVSQTTKILARYMLRRPVRYALDLGTGCGALALMASKFAHSVTAADLNPRALRFTELNEALNGLSNISCVEGDRFEPVSGRKFDFIVSNPPFFVTPDHRLLHSDNPMELDGFVQSLIESAGEHLQVEGIFQMLFEWVQIGGEPWQNRLARWFENCGCDVHLMVSGEAEPAEYIRKRVAERRHLYPGREEILFEEGLRYFADRGVETITGGLVTMRRRDAKNWLLLEEMPESTQESLGECILGRIAAQDFLVEASEEEQLDSCPRLSMKTRLVEHFVPQAGSWQPKTLYLECTDGMPAKLGLEPLLAEMIGRMDGGRPLRQLLDELCQKTGDSRESIFPMGLKLLRRLALGGFLVY